MSLTTYNRRFAALYVVAIAAAILAALLLPSEVLAAGSKGGGNISKAGDNASDLVTSIVGPLLIVAIGCVAVVAFMSRNMGMAVGAVACGLVAGLFVFEPSSAQDAFQGVYKAIF